MNYQTIEQELAELPLYIYAWVDPQSLEFSDRVRHICQTECAMYGKSWACPPGVGTVAECRAKCLSYNKALLISSLTEVADIADLEATLATRRDHESLTDQVGDILRAHGLDPYILSTEACAICGRCAILDGKPCRYPEKMHPCVESQGINIIPTLEENGLEFQYGQNVVTWVSLLLFETKTAE